MHRRPTTAEDGRCHRGGVPRYFWTHALSGRFLFIVLGIAPYLIKQHCLVTALRVTGGGFDTPGRFIWRAHERRISYFVVWHIVLASCDAV